MAKRPKDVAQNVYNNNRRNLFENDAVSLWLTPSGTPGTAHLELRRRQSRAVSTVLWRGAVSMSGNAVVTRRLPVR